MANTAATKSDLAAIGPLRAVFLRELNAQVRYDAVHGRGWSDSYLLAVDGVTVGYGAVKGLDDHAARDAVFEFFLVRPYRHHATALFRELVARSGATHVECQSNEPVLTSLLNEHCEVRRPEVVLFEDHAVTHLAVAGVAVRRRREEDAVFDHASEPAGDYVAVRGDEVVASGGFLCHYNPPFADLFMEVRPDCRRQGIGSLLVQEVKTACYLAGRVPAARCNAANAASRATLARAGLRECGFMLVGRIA